METGQDPVSDRRHQDIPTPPDIEEHAEAFTELSSEHFERRQEFDRLLTEMESLKAEIFYPPDYRIVRDDVDEKTRAQFEEIRSKLRELVAEDFEQ